jgi:hypothetical protein
MPTLSVNGEPPVTLTTVDAGHAAVPGSIRQTLSATGVALATAGHNTATVASSSADNAIRTFLIIQSPSPTLKIACVGANENRTQQTISHRVH